MTLSPAGWLERPPAAAPALAWPGGLLTRGGLAERIARLAGAVEAALSPGAPLAVVSASRAELVIGVLAGAWSGRPVLPLEPGRPDLAALLAVCGVGAAVTDHDAVLPAGLARIAPDAAAAPRAAATPAATALLVPTSGTTGAARVAMLPAPALAAQAAASAQRLPALGARDRWVVCLPMTSIGGLAALWRCMAAGACLAVLERFDAGAALALMAEGASHASVVPAMLDPLLEAGAPPPALRCLLAGGGPLSAAAAGRAVAAGWPLWTGWGMTETASHVAAGPVDSGWREGQAGRALPGMRIAADPDSGRLRVAGPALMSGYAAPGLAPGAGLEADGSFLTGDLGEVDRDGTVRLRGRADDAIVTGGVNVDPATVEAALAACPGAGETAVCGLADPRWGQRLVALYTGNAPVGTLEAWARDHLPSPQRPRRYLRVASLPRNAMGKLVRRDLPALAGVGPS